MFEAAVLTFTGSLDDVSPLMVTVLSALRERKDTPTRPVTIPLPRVIEVMARIKLLEESCNAPNAIFKQDANMVDRFNEHQKKA